MITTLKERLKEWTDWDVTIYEVGVVLGIFEPGTDDDPRVMFRNYKGVFWSNNALGNSLEDTLDGIVATGAVEVDEHSQRYRWNKDFDVSNEEYQ